MNRHTSRKIWNHRNPKSLRTIYLDEVITLSVASQGELSYLLIIESSKHLRIKKVVWGASYGTGACISGTSGSSSGADSDSL